MDTNTLIIQVQKDEIVRQQPLSLPRFPTDPKFDAQGGDADDSAISLPSRQNARLSGSPITSVHQSNVAGEHYPQVHQSRGAPACTMPLYPPTNGSNIGPGGSPGITSKGGSRPTGSPALHTTGSGPTHTVLPKSRGPRHSTFRSLLCCFSFGNSGGSGRHREHQPRGKAPVIGSDIRSHGDFNLQPRASDHLSGGMNKNGTVDTSYVQPILQSLGNDPYHSNTPSCEDNDGMLMGPTDPLLPPIGPLDIDRNCLIVDLDETLVHSSFKPVENPDFIVPVELDGITHQVYVLKRPFVDEFLARVGRLFECVLFTASLAKYADPVANLLDPDTTVFRSRLFREACVFHEGSYVKDLGMLGRNLKRCIIIDNSPASFSFHPENAIPVTSWFDDQSDNELAALLPFLERLARVENVYTLLSMLRRQQSPSPPPSSEGSMENLNV